MYHTPYKYDTVHARQYTFKSLGKREIVKVVEFIPTSTKNVYNLGFGDLLSNGEIDDTANSNNGGIIKIFATVIDILQHFTQKYPSVTIVFAGSTEDRTKLYNRIIKRYYQEFCKLFYISGAVETEDGVKYIPFDAGNPKFYVVFFVKRIN